MAMSRYLFNKYTALSIGVQFIACLLIWIVAFAISPAGDSFFGLMFYFYLPAIFLVSTALSLKGESGMIAAGIYGIAFGILLYGVIFRVCDIFPQDPPLKLPRAKPR